MAQDSPYYLVNGQLVDAWGNVAPKDAQTDDAASTDYASWTAQALTDELNRRVEAGRPIDVGSIKKKAEAIAALEADDAKAAEGA